MGDENALNNETASSKAKPKKSTLGIIAAIPSLIGLVAIIFALVPMPKGHGGVSNQTESPYIAGGLSFVDEPSWEVSNYNGTKYIEINGKVKSDTWIGSPVRVVVTFYDADGAILGTSGDSIMDMQADDIWSYKVNAAYEGLSYFVIDGVTY